MSLTLMTTIIVSGLFALLLIMLGSFCLFKRCKRRQNYENVIYRSQQNIYINELNSAENPYFSTSLLPTSPVKQCSTRLKSPQKKLSKNSPTAETKKLEKKREAPNVIHDLYICLIH